MLLFADLVGTVLLVLPAAMGGPLWTVVAGIVAAGAGASLWSVLVAVLRQERTPPALLGRVYSASRVLSWGALLGSALAAFLAHWLDVGQILGAAAVLAIMTAAWFPLLRINRHLAEEETQVSLKELVDHCPTSATLQIPTLKYDLVHAYTSYGTRALSVT